MPNAERRTPNTRAWIPRSRRPDHCRRRGAGAGLSDAGAAAHSGFDGDPGRLVPHLWPDLLTRPGRALTAAAALGSGRRAVVALREAGPASQPPLPRVTHRA